MSHGVGLAEILHSQGQSYFATHVLSAVQKKAWRAIVACRTPVLGGHVACCDHCGVLRYHYHSCRNRHCPQCQTRTKEAWLAARQRELLPLPYFHLVFTLPHALNRPASYDAQTLYAMLFNAVSATLNEFAANPRWLGGIPSFTLVLHTWKQDLGRHIHVHALVAGGALTTSNDWVSPRRNCLFPVRALSRVYRGKLMAALDAVRQANGLRHDVAKNDVSWRNLLIKLRRHNWVVYAKQPLGSQAHKCWNIWDATRTGWPLAKLTTTTPTELLQKIEIEGYLQHAKRQIDQIERRVIKGKIIPHQEKVFSLFEPHTEWISKGKAGVPVELGVKVCVLEDQYQFILHHHVMEKETDEQIAVARITEAKKTLSHTQRLAASTKAFIRPPTKLNWPNSSTRSRSLKKANYPKCVKR